MYNIVKANTILVISATWNGSLLRDRRKYFAHGDVSVQNKILLQSN